MAIAVDLCRQSLLLKCALIDLRAVFLALHGSPDLARVIRPAVFD
jgi:hypothetical protein